MKLITLISIFCLGLFFAACGSDDDPATATTQEAQSETPEASGETQEAQSETLATSVPGMPKPPVVRLPPGPPPTKAEIKDLKVGTGAVAEEGQTLRVHFVSVSYKTGKTFEVFWGNRTLAWPLGSGEVVDGWETGLPGMRVGGIRQLDLPSKLAYETGPFRYVVELIAIE